MSLLCVLTLTVVVCNGVVYGGCVEHQYCDDPMEILSSKSAVRLCTHVCMSSCMCLYYYVYMFACVYYEFMMYAYII